MKKIGIVDTMFASVDMFAIAKQAIISKDKTIQIERYTVPGVKDLAVACKKLFEEQIITSEEFEGYNRLLEYNKINLYYTTLESFENSLSGLFQIEKTLLGYDYTGHLNHPIYILRKVPS